MGDSADMDELLRAGIAAAQAGQREKARTLLTRVVEEDDGNAHAWLWLSGVVDSLDNQEVCLQHVVALDPSNKVAQRGLELIRRQRLDTLLQAGIAAAQKGQRDHARKLLMRLVEQEEANLQAWVWLSELVDNLDDREICLENALTLDAENEELRQKLAALHRQKEDQAAAAAQAMALAVPVAEPGTEEPGQRPAAAVPAPSPGEGPFSPGDEFANIYLCPYCAAPTQPGDRKCRACRNGLWSKTRKREECSSWLWIAVSLQLGTAAWDFAGAVMLLMYVGFRSGAASALDLLPLYFWLPSKVSPEVAAAALAALPRPIFLASTLGVLISLVVVTGLFMRWRPFFYLFLANAVLLAVLAISGMLISRGIALLCGGVGVLLALAVVWLAFQIQDDFFHDRRRILMEAHREAMGGLDFLVHARRYAKERMWALAALHFRRAAVWLPDQIEAHLGLAVAYTNLRRYDMAAQALADARRINPSSPQVQEMAATLDRLTAAGRPPSPSPA